MDVNEKYNIMLYTAGQVKKLISERMAKRFEMIKALEYTNLEDLPESVKQMREIQKAQNIAVMQEQSDIIGLLEIMLPDAKK